MCTVYWTAKRTHLEQHKLEEEKMSKSELINVIIESLKKLNKEDLEMLLSFICSLNKVNE